MRVLVAGSTGLLGRALVQEWRNDRDEVIGVSSREMDICDPDRVDRVVSRAKPECLVLLAAYTDVDGCEDNPSLARAVNRDGAENVARAAREGGSRLVFVSTDYVFSGTKDTPYEVSDLTAALNVYGRTKAEAEQRLRALVPDVCIVRTSWLFGAEGKCFPNTILSLAAARRGLRVVDDQRGCPTFNRDLASALVRLAQAGAGGTIHVTNAGSCTWFEFAEYLLREAGVQDIVLQPTSSKDFPRPAKRPRNSILSPASAHQHGIFLQDWQSAVKAYLVERVALQGSQAQPA